MTPRRRSSQMRTRQADKWETPSTVIGIGVVLVTLIVFAFKIVPVAGCIPMGIFGGYLIQGNPLSGMARFLRKP